MIWNIPNILSVARLAIFLPILWVVAIAQQPVWLGVLLSLALATDAADGYLARTLNQVTALGAKLDSIADSSLWISAVVWLVIFCPDVLLGRSFLLLVLAVGLWAVTIAIGWIRFHRFANLHLYSDKISAVIGSVFLVLSLLFGFQAWLFYLAVGSFVLASIEAIVLLLTRTHVDEHIGSLFRRARADERLGSQFTSSGESR